jgi:putative DNA primase/helicase
VLLSELAALVVKHVVVDDHANVATALWIPLSYLIDVVDIMPILAITSPEKRCGKSTLLELLMRLVRRPMPGVSLSAATVFRSIEKWHPTLLIDEADGLFKNARGDDNLELRTVINSGHTRAFAFVPRCEGDNHEVRNFSTWSPKVIALIGKMPDSMADRSIHIDMKRKTKADTVAKLRETLPGVFEELRQKIVRFVNDHTDAIRAAIPSFPPGLNDRAEDCWSPLFAIAEAAGGNWPALARRAAVALSGDDDSADTFITVLLRALKQDFEDYAEDHPDGFQTTTDICDHLNLDKEAPWHGSKYKNGMTEELLASRLRRYKVKSDRPFLNGKKVRGFYWSKLNPIFDRYL